MQAIPLKVSKGMVGCLMGCWMTICPDVDTVEEVKDLPEAGDTPDEVTAISIRCIFSCILSISCCSSVRLYEPSTLIRVDEN